ncbi:MAG: serine hydrolase domain-containing protein [Pseudomonadales bacterium]
MTLSMSKEQCRQVYSKLFNTIDVADNIASVTTIDGKGEVQPTTVGLSQVAAANIWQAVENLYATGYYPALLFCLRRDGEIVFNRAIGHTTGNGPHDTEDTRKVLATPATPSCLFSASKPMSAMVAHKLEEQGKLNMLNPISHYIPEFGTHGKEKTTIFHLLSHRAGIPMVEGIDDIRVIFDHEYCLQRLCDTKPVASNNRDQAYHAVTSGIILDEIVRRVTGKDMRTLWRQYFKTPMGFKTFDYGATAAVQKKLADQNLTGMQNRHILDPIMKGMIGGTLGDVVELLDEPQFYQSVIPSANMFATAEEASRFYDMLLNDGKWRGKTILQPETIHRATMEAGPHMWDKTIGIPLRFSQGFMLGGERFGMYGPGSEQAFGHLGLINNMVWADPERKISVALLLTGMPLLATNMPAYVRLLWAVANNCPKV